jgi:hypothetical protein
MTTPSCLEQVGLIVQVGNPIFSGESFLFNLQESVDAYNHRKSAQGGYLDASVGAKVSQQDAEGWLEEGLGRDIEVLDSSLRTTFNGFVDQIEVSLGGKKEVRGPVSGIANRIAVIYSTIDTSVDPPVVGNRVLTPYASDLQSQSRYGIISKIVSLGGVTEVEAPQYRDSLLRALRIPKSSGTLSSDSASPYMSLKIKGYYEYFKFNSYTNLTGGTVNLSSKISSIIVADPNGIFTIRKLLANTFQVPAWEDEDRTEESLLKTLVGLGDTSDNRYTFGVYKDRQVVYDVAPPASDPVYTYSITDGAFLTNTDSPVDPWRIEPCQWVFSKDWMLGRTTSGLSTVLEEDPRYRFIEEVVYTAPYGWSINGVQGSRLDQSLAKLQLRGM